MNSSDAVGVGMLGSAIGFVAGVVVGAVMAAVNLTDRVATLQKEAVAHGYAEVVTTGGEKVFVWKEKE